MSGPSIFISYRRSDSASSAGRLADHISREFGRESVFMDIDAIRPGDDFVEVLSQQVRHSDVVLAVIGPQWLQVMDQSGKRRIDSANDFVRLELEAALAANKLVVPVLVENARMPSPASLPEALQGLAHRNAVSIRHETFGPDVARLVEALHRVWSPTTPTEPPKQAQETRRPEVAHAESIEADIVELFVRLREGGTSLQTILDRLELANADAMIRSDDHRELRTHLQRFPNGVTKAQVQARLETLYWQRAQASNEVSGYVDYLSLFPHGVYSEQAREMRDRLTVASAGVDAGPRVFLNYRRVDSADSADRIYKVLTELLPKQNVLMDVDQHSLIPGLPQKDQLEKLVTGCDIMLCLIRDRWVQEIQQRSEDHQAQRKLDFVRTEIVAALEHSKPTFQVPVLLGGTPMPDVADVPPDIKPFLGIAASRFRRDSFESDCRHLVRLLLDRLEDGE